MSRATTEALTMRDLAVTVAGQGGTFTDARLKITHRRATADAPHTIEVWKRSGGEIKVLEVVWRDGGDDVITLHHVGSWQGYLERLAVNLDRRFQGL